MITFFQKHKTFRTIIYTIVVITFVGAGFLGWGAYNFNNKNVVAYIYDNKIYIKDIDNTIDKILLQQFSNYQGKDKTEVIANYKKNNIKTLQKMALEVLKRQYSIIHYTNAELFINASDKEIFNKLKEEKLFQKDGKFDLKTYKETLSNSGFYPADFEKMIKNDLVLEKFDSLLFENLKSTDFETKLFRNMLSFYQEIVLTNTKIPDNITNIDVNETALKSFWKNNKLKYNTKTFFEISYNNYHNDNNLSLEDFKKDILKKYIDLKKVNGILDKKQTIYEDNILFNQLNIVNENDILKPIFDNNSSKIIKLHKKHISKVKTFDEAKEEVLKDFKIESFVNKIKNSKENMNNGDNYIGKISNLTSLPIKLINKFDNREDADYIYNILINNIKPEGIIVYKDNIVKYKIIDTGFLKEDEIDNKNILDIIDDLLLNIKKEDYINYKIID